MENEERLRELARLDYECHAAEAAARLGYQVDFAKMVFNSLVLANGGALVALFTLVGNLNKNGASQLLITPSRLWVAFSLFSLGLFATLVAGVASYFTQRFYYDVTMYEQWFSQARSVGTPTNDEWDVGKASAMRLGNGFMVVAVIGVLIAVVSFLAGSGAGLMAVLPR